MTSKRYNLNGLRKPLIYLGVAYITFFPQAFTSPDRLKEMRSERFSQVSKLESHVEEGLEKNEK